MKPIPQPTGKAGWSALQSLIQQRHVLASLGALHNELGDVFQIPLPGFNTLWLIGPEANHFMLVEAKKGLNWRTENDPVTRLLRHGFLVEDGDFHDQLRGTVNPALHRNMLSGYVEKMWRRTDEVTNQWADGSTVNLLDEMRRVALLVLMDTLFDENFSDDLQPLWNAILRTIQYISPGVWLVMPGLPRPGYRQALRQMDDYLFRLIRQRRQQPKNQYDLLGGLIEAGLSDDLIRDQLLTLFIAGHDTSTALIAWTLYLLLRHPFALERVQAEVDHVLGSNPPSGEHQLPYLDQVIKETLRLYPPIHLGSRIANTDLDFQGYTIPANTRVLYSIYLTHRHKAYWSEPEKFDPDRFTPEQNQARKPYVYLPFGGGARNCVGYAFAQVEARIILARIIQNYQFGLVQPRVRPNMKATLEPYPGVFATVKRRQ